MALPLGTRHGQLPFSEVDVRPLAAAKKSRYEAPQIESETYATSEHGVVTALARYHWPGNVRELQNAIAGLAVEAPTRGQVRPALLPAALTGATAVHAGRLADTRAQFERRFVEVALARAGGSRSRAARELGLSRQGRTERSWTAWGSMAPVEMCGTRHSCASNWVWVPFPAPGAPRMTQSRLRRWAPVTAGRLRRIYSRSIRIRRVPHSCP